ncbi:glycosyltransferase family 4 protein [Ferribacterium limneticum]|uniref:glycosyltransferase family 4 protein n=1 Tax=Ferribacterium limneticum TaxID=76259 RepID=UPI001CFA70E7|nr:glycosyltransferase family 4 protein [Ferribacterium limneticum]UCV18277.1 glycosyltransferase family 4 protein [Ferribacterium limneticum]
MKTVAIVSSQAFSLVNFRGPLIRQLVEENFRVLALAPDYDEDLRGEVSALGAQPVDFSLQRTGMSPWRDLLDTIRLTVLLRRLRPDVALAYFIKPVIFGTLAAWLAGVPHRIAMIEGLGYVFSVSDKGESFKRRMLRFVVSRLYKLALSRAGTIVFLNDDDRDEFSRLGMVRHESSFVLGGIGVDLDEWSAEPPVFSPLTFLLAARLLREKGIAEFASAARLLKQLVPEARFVLLGGLESSPGGIGLSEVEHWVAEGVLEWPGHVHVQPWLRQASVFVLPSYYREGVPRSTQEAMAMGRPVITTDAPGCRETVVDGENGFLVPVRDVPALVEAMLKFIEQPKLVESMGRCSRHMAEVRFDVRRANRRLLDIIGVIPA